MSEIKDGGPAFPVSGFANDAGMSLRDYFAGQALMGFLASTDRPTTIAEDDAAWCYIIADAMIAERERSK